MAMSLGGGASSKRLQPTPNVNVTPLVDVALVVLIIFMVVTPMMTKTFWLNLPKQDEKQEPTPPSSNQPLVMKAMKDGRLRINNAVLTKQELQERLPRMLAAKKSKVLYFDADDDLPYGSAVEAMDMSRAGGARSIAILTKKLAD